MALNWGILMVVRNIFDLIITEVEDFECFHPCWSESAAFGVSSLI